MTGISMTMTNDLSRYPVILSEAKDPEILIKKEKNKMKKFNDEVIQGMTAGNEVRYFAAYTGGVVEEARRIHNTSPISTAALGRTLTAGAMMGAMCKNDTDVLTLQFKGDGPLGGVTVTANAKAEVKGLVNNPNVILPKNAAGHLNVGGAMGNGFLRVIKDIGMKDPYIGQTELVSGEIGEDLTYYFAASEQIPTSVGVGVLLSHDNVVEHAGGFIIQLLPFATEQTIRWLEEVLAGVHSVTEYFADGYSLDDLVHALLGGDATIERRMPVSWKCGCNREKVEKTLMSVGRAELLDMIREGEPVTLHCDFCNTDYTFSIPEIRQLLDSGRVRN